MLINIYLGSAEAIFFNAWIRTICVRYSYIIELQTLVFCIFLNHDAISFLIYACITVDIPNVYEIGEFIIIIPTVKFVFLSAYFSQIEKQ